MDHEAAYLIHRLEVDLGLSDMEDSAGVTPPVLNPAQKVGPSTAADMEIRHLEDAPLEDSAGLPQQGRYPAADHDSPMYSPEIYDESYNVDDFLGANAEGMGHSAAADMEMAQWEFNSLVEVVNAGLPQPTAGSYPAGDAGTSTATGMEIPHSVDAQPAEFHSLKANAGATQPAYPYFVGDIDPSTSTEKIIHRLHAINEHHNKEQREKNFGQPRSTNADLAKLDPGDLPADQQCYITKSRIWCPDDHRTRQGYWKEKEAMLIRTTPSPSGQWCPSTLKRTLEFHKEGNTATKEDKTATKWFMHEYSLLRDAFLEKWGPSSLCIGDDIVIRQVFKNDKGWVCCPSRKMANNGEPDDKLNRKNISHSDCSHPYAVQNDQAPSGKRPRTDDPKSTKESHVWQHFTRIYVKVPTEAGSKKKDCYKLVYAVCHHCDRVFKASTKNGTTHLGRHADACKCNHS